MRILSKFKKPKAARILGGALGLLLASSLVLVPAPVLAAPALPHQFYGTVTTDDELAPEGTIVSAQIDEIEYLSTTVDAQGRYGYDPLFKVPADDPNTPEKEGGVAGETVELYVSDTLADRYEFEFFGITKLDLTVGIATFTITATAGENGAIEPLGDVSVNSGADQPFTITPSEGYEIADVLVDSVSVLGELLDNTYTFDNVTAGHTIDATFALQTFTITSTAEAGGSIDPLGVTEVDYGTDQAFAITAETGYEIADVLVDSVSEGAIESYLFENVTVGHTIDATFATTETFTITATAGENGAIEPSGDVVVNSGASQPFTITPETGFAVDDVLVDGVSVLGELVDNTYTFENVTVGHTIAATFATTETFTITATAGDNGTISPSGEVVVNSGADQAFTITPNTGFTVDDVLVDSVSEGAITSYTFENVTAGHTIDVTFAAVIGDLGDLIDEADPGETIELEAGTYSGNITIDIPMTIRGSEEGTTISGGIHVAPLTGSNVTIENLTITEYIDYGIWIELVSSDDVFTIRNNSIEGVAGSIGIQVDEVEAGGILSIRQNNITGNDTGIKLEDLVASGSIEFNDITGNTTGLEQLAEVGAYAGLNWWGDASGPEEENQNPGGIGDPVVGAIGYQPWLTREFQTVLDDNISYFGYSMFWLSAGWNIMSTPIALDPACDTWGEYVDLGDGLDIHETSPAWRFDAENQAWVVFATDDTLEPCEAIYVRMASDDIAPILLSPDRSVPSKELYSGWNLVGLAWLQSNWEAVYGLPADEALVTVEQVTGDLTGYKLVVSPSVNPFPESSWIHMAGGTIDPWTDPNLQPPAGWMLTGSGYWVFMLNDGTLAGFTFTPVSLPEQPD